jgi:hypothetical protein
MLVGVLLCSVFSLTATHQYSSLDSAEVFEDSIERSFFESSLTNWADDFEDGNFDDWDITGANFTSEGVVACAGGCSVVNGAMTIDGEEYTMASHDSTTAYGTWVFDLDIVNTGFGEFLVPFIGDENGLYGTISNVYLIQFYDDTGGLRFLQMKTGEEYQVLAEWNEGYGWKHFVITRDTSGYFCIYVNGTLKAEAVANGVTESQWFWIEAMAGPSIDNIMVNDSVLFDAAPPRWTDLDDRGIFVDLEFGEDFRFDMNATDFSGIDSWRVNDTANFAVDSDGVVTNTVPLEAGRYYLEVTVEDTLGYERTKLFVITVEGGAVAFDPLMLSLIGVGAVAVIVVLIVIMKKRGS